tara:strand:+ start:512 stop:2698 length:2187 start_codon:yes stop_codon:yes gene_type:complete
MSFDHLVLVGGGHSNVLLMHNWLMQPNLMPDVPITIISRDSSLVYSSMYPSVISRTIKLKESLIDISSLANRAKISFIKSDVCDIDFLKKKIILQKRPSIEYSRIILNCGSNTKISDEYKDLVRQKIAFPIRPFLQSYQFIKSEDPYNSSTELPFVIIGSGLAAIEIAFALRKRWVKRKLILVCDPKKISNKFLKILKVFNIKVRRDMNFIYKRILLCTGNNPQIWIKNNILELDNQGRIITSNNLRAIGKLDIYAVGDCAYVGRKKNRSSGILAVKSSRTLSENIIRDFNGKTLKKWSPQKLGLQIVNLFNQNDDYPMSFAVYGKYVLGPSTIFWHLKNKIDNNFLQKFKNLLMDDLKDKSNNIEMDCRGCAAKIPQNILNNSLSDSKLNKFADSPEDASELFRSNKKIILQSIDGFPSLVSDPWLNAKITTLHACSDLWACGAKLLSGQVLISVPKVNNSLQKYIFSQSLEGVRSVFDELGGEIIGGHTYESRNLSKKPYSLGVDLALSVQGILDIHEKPWRKYGMKPGDVLLMSRPLGIGIFFAAKMKNINIFHGDEEIFKDLQTSQQNLIENIKSNQEKLGKEIVNAATDITGYGLLGHLNEMIKASNLRRRSENMNDIKVNLWLDAIKFYPGILDLIKQGIKSSLYYENHKIFDLISKQQIHKQSINFCEADNNFSNEEYKAIKELLFDPQTCGPILISCDSKYENYFDNNWYKIGVVMEKDI